MNEKKCLSNLQMLFFFPQLIKIFAIDFFVKKKKKNSYLNKHKAFTTTKAAMDMSENSAGDSKVRRVLSRRRWNGCL